MAAECSQIVMTLSEKADRKNTRAAQYNVAIITFFAIRTD